LRNRVLGGRAASQDKRSSIAAAFGGGQDQTAKRRMSEKQRARDLAYRVWVQCGQNFSETERKLKRDCELPVTRQTLMAWAEKYGWKGRAARTEAEMQNQQTAIMEGALVAALARQKERYEKYFDELGVGKIDNQACYAFCGLVKTMISVKRQPGLQPESALQGGAEDPKTEVHAKVISGDEERVSAIEGLIDLWLGKVLADPEKVNAGLFREIRGALAIIEEIRGKAAAWSESAEKIVEASTAAEAPQPGDALQGGAEEQKRVIIAGPEDAKAALWEAFSRMIAAMLANPEKIKVSEIERAQAYLAKMTEAAAPQAEEEAGSLEQKESSLDPYELVPKKGPDGQELDPGLRRGDGLIQEIDHPEEAEVLTDIGLWTEEEAISALQDFVGKQLALMRKESGAAKASQVKVVKEAMELIEELRKKTKPADDGQKKKGLSTEMAEELREKLLRGENT